MGLQQLTVEDLFGEFTHQVDLHVKEGLTLVHGPNGVGKTTVLRIVEALFAQRFSVLSKLPFASLQASLTDGDRIQVTRKPTTRDKGKNVPAFVLEFIVTSASGRAQTWTYRRAVERDFPLHMVDDYVAELSRVGPSEWYDVTSGETLDLELVLDKYADRLPVPARSQSDVPEWLRDVLRSVPVYFIGAQRLQSASSPRLARYRRGNGDGVPQMPAVLVHAEDLAERIKRTLASYGEYSQKLDSTFPTRLLEGGQNAVALNQEAIRARYSAQADRRNRYVRAGLLDAGSELLLPDRPLEDYEERVLSMLLDDADDKLDQLSALSAKVDLFLEIINGKFRRKQLSVDRERGFKVHTAADEMLDLPSLSSGEQQEIVLAYGLLFREQPGTLILVDEPELSLHISWQMDLIPDLLRIADLAQLTFLIATHSPQVIGERWDLTVELSDGA